MRYFVVLFLIVVACDRVRPAEPDNPVVQQAAAELASRVANLESRVSALEKLADHALETGVVTPPPKQTYAEAHAKSLATGKPLVVWSGAAVCPSCVRETNDEFVSYVGSDVPGLAPDAVSVYVPENGTLHSAGDVTWWVTNDATYGHVPSVRRMVANWRANRRSYRQSGPTVSVSNTTTFGMGSPMMYRQPMPRMFFGRGGACASCGG